MLTSPFNPQAEKDALLAALSRFHDQWQREPTIQAFLDLCDATERANEVLMVLKTGAAKDHQTTLHIICLKFLLNAAMHALDLTHEEPLAFSHPYPATEEASCEALATLVPQGTIVSCSACGEGLYKVTQDASLLGIVVDEGSLLVPLNRDIPTRHAWTSLACPLCGGLVLRNGKIHTFQHGWL